MRDQDEDHSEFFAALKDEPVDDRPEPTIEQGVLDYMMIRLGAEHLMTLAARRALEGPPETPQIEQAMLVAAFETFRTFTDHDDGFLKRFVQELATEISDVPDGALRFHRAIDRAFKPAWEALPHPVGVDCPTCSDGAAVVHS